MGNGSSKQKTIPGDGSFNNNVLVRKPFKETYNVTKDLGSGAFSIVKLALHKTTGKQTAVKIITKKKLSEEDLAALMTEISILCELDHPHIIKCFETFDEGLEFYIVTELVAGGELFDRIVAKTHYTEKEARDLVKMFLETMAYMHGKGVVHRDLKPENLLLCSEIDDSDIKIADFGFAKKTCDLLPNETACGTPGYVAPEILRGDRYGTEVDIWSMGVICYVLLAGYPPFYDEDQKKLFKKIKEGKYHFHQDYWCNTSPDAMDMIKKMLCVNQSERWSAKQLLSHPWITAGDAELQAKDLSKSIEAMKKYKAKMRFKAVTNAIIMTNRMRGAFKAKSRENSTGPTGGVIPTIIESTPIPDTDPEPRFQKDDNTRSEADSSSSTEPPTPHGERSSEHEKDPEEENTQTKMKKKKSKQLSSAAVNQSMMEEVAELEDDDMSHMVACID